MFDRQLIRNFLLYGAHHGIRFAFPLIATPFLAHVLMKDGFSDFAIINSCIWTSTVFMEFGFYLYGVARTAAAREDRAQLRQVVSTITAAKLALSPLASAVYLALCLWTGVLQREPAAVLLGLACALGYGASFAWYLQGRQRGLAAVLSELIPQSLQFALLLLFVRRPQDLWLVIALQALPPFASASYALFDLAKDRLLSRVSLAGVRTALAGGSPYFVERLCYATYTSILPSLIVLLSSKAAVADYSIGDRFGTLLAGLVGPLTQAAMPRVARAVGDPGGGWRLSIGLVGLIVSVVLVLGLLVVFSVGWIIDIFFADTYAGAAPVARIFCAIALCSAIGSATANFVLIPRNHARVMFWSSGAALVLGLAAQFVFTPALGAQGAALGRLVAEASVAVVLVGAALRLYRREHRAGSAVPSPAARPAPEDG